MIDRTCASHAIAALEARHDTKLFHRVGRRIELTEAGRARVDKLASEYFEQGNLAVFHATAVTGT
jgi:hypothetical protein